MSRSATMTTDGKRALAKTVRGLRARLLEDLGEAMERAYRLSIDGKRAQLDEASRIKRSRLEVWIDEQARALPAKAQPGAAERLRGDIVKDAAATLLLRLVYLRLLEASGLSAVKVVTGGWDSRGYKDFREAAPELVRPGNDDETEGYATLLGLVFDELAHDLPSLYGPVRMTSLVPVPAATLRAVVDALDDAELASVWTDDTALGWIYQYWNDPEREALDAKLAASKKLENHEIAAKTQMFTERYMVEWLLHNTLGQMWLAMCRKHGWRADAESSGVLDRLEARRVAWRARREAGEVALDALMPIEPGLEDRWKYWVPQPMADDAVASAPDSVRSLKLLDPACGSGHFLVIAFELLFALYQEEARHRGESWSERDIVESILANNLHGIDIDPKAVQIAAAALMLKARQLCPDAQPGTLNLVAPALSLASLAEDDPARLGLYQSIEQETGIPPELTARIVGALAGADHLGTLLKVDAAIDTAIADFGAQLSAAVPTQADQGGLFADFAPRRRKRITAEQAKAAVLDRLERFLEHHTGGADLGLRLRGEQLAAGVRFVRMVHEGQYDIVIGNPPYQGTSKMADKAYVEKHYPRGKADLYAAFLERGLQLAREGGVSALLTMRNWMFIKQFSALRERLLETYDLRMLGDVDRGAFEDVPDEVVSVVMSIFRSAQPTELPSVAMQPTLLDDKTRDSERTKRKRGAVLCQVGRHAFRPAQNRVVPTAPMLYWWTDSAFQFYSEGTLVRDACPTAFGLTTGNNARFTRKSWEVSAREICEIVGNEIEPTTGGLGWAPFILGAAGREWIEPLDDLLRWRAAGLEIKTRAEFQYGTHTKQIRSEHLYFQRGIAFSPIGNVFSTRMHRYKSIISNNGCSLYPLEATDALCSSNSAAARNILQSISPGIGFEVGDVERLPLWRIEESAAIFGTIEREFSAAESHREKSVEYRFPGNSGWSAAQAWAQLAVDRSNGAPLPPYEPEYEAEQPTDHVSFAVGVALGRFGASGEGILAEAPATALPHGILFLSDASDDDSLAHPAGAPILAAWATHGGAIDDRRTLKNYLQDRFFSDVHRTMYENRPIYFPLSSAKKSFVAYVSIHRWTGDTLNHLLAEHLCPAKKRLEGELTDLRSARDGGDRKAAKAAEKRFGEVGKWLDELTTFIAAVEQCAEKGPPPPDAKTRAREVHARYDLDLDDGVMINSAALWPLLEPQWKDPKKWWKELAGTDAGGQDGAGKKDYDWSHLAARYFPTRVDARCKLDPSLAVAHGCFWKYHPARAYQWELRLKDEIRPDFTLDEPASEAARAAFEAEHPEAVEQLVAKEHLRRQRKQAKANGTVATDGDGEDDGEPAQGALDLAAGDEDDDDAHQNEARDP